MTASQNLTVLLIEDNPGDVRLIEEMLRESEELIQRFDFDDQFTGRSEIVHERTLEAGIEQLSAGGVDVVLLDLGLPDSKGIETLTTVTDATEFVPVVVLTGLNDGAIGIKAIQQGAQDFLIKDEVTSDLLVRSIHYAIERNRQERERARRREQLKALNRLNEIGQAISHTVITMSSREELERAVCEQLTQSEAYRFAWIGEVDRASDQVKPRVATGVDEGYVDDITITIDEGETAEGPTGKAVRTRETQVMQNIRTNPAYEPWREQAIARGYQSSAAVPIQYEDHLYGVLNIYAASPSAFSEPEVRILSRLGDVIGHAIAAIDRKEALESDRVLELEFQTDELAPELAGLTTDRDSRITVDSFIRTDDTVLGYGRVVQIPESTFRDALAESSFLDEFRVLSSGEQTYRFELVTRAISPLFEAVTTHGGRITSATIDDGAFQFVVEFLPGRDKRQLIDLVLEHCPGAEVHAQRTVERNTEDISDTRSILLEELTDQQRTALETAYSAGLFEWPRKSTGGELADRLGISSPTFSQHLRAAEQKFFDQVFTDERDEIPDPEA